MQNVAPTFRFPNHSLRSCLESYKYPLRASLIASFHSITSGEKQTKSEKKLTLRFSKQNPNPNLAIPPSDLIYCGHGQSIPVLACRSGQGRDGPVRHPQPGRDCN